jgi:hypothetical protein
MTRDGRAARILLALVAAVCVVLPLLVVRFPPVSDLPQHLAQVRLFLDAVENPHSVYHVQWLTPYSLVYGLLGAAWVCCEPLAAGRVALIGLGLLCVAATHRLAAARQRPPEGALLASLLFFSPVLYWGFLSFAIGWPAFVLWLLVTTRGATNVFTWRQALTLLGGALLLYVSHALWLAAGLAWLVLHSIVFRAPWRVAALRAASVSPVLVAAALWYPHLAARGFVSPTVWSSTPTAHLSFSWLASAAVGGLQGPTKYVMFGALVGWIGLSAWQRRDSFWDGIDRELLLASALCGACALLFPYKHMNTVEFAERWMPPALALLVLAVPAPLLKPSLLRYGVCAVATVFSLSTAVAWTRFERNDLSGLADALSALPDSPRVLGLDFVKTSPIIDNAPFLQLAAYAQVLHGGTLYLSFADFAPSLVVFNERRRMHWTADLEWEAERVQPSDLQYFDFAIIGGTDAVHERFTADPLLTPLTSRGLWRLYRIRQAGQ